MTRRTVLLLAPKAPPHGGMAVQAQLLASMLRGDGHEVVFLPSNLPFNGGFGWIGRVPALRTCMRVIMLWLRFWREFPQVDLIHILAASWFYFFTVVSPAVLIARMRGKRAVLNYRGGEAERFFNSFGWALKPVFRLSRVVTAPSEFLAATIRSYFGIPVQVVPNILDSSAFQYRQRMVFQPKMLVARQLEKAYDVESVLKAFRAVQTRYPEASLCIAGTGSEEQRLRDLATEWKLSNVHFLGHVRHEDLPVIYSQCDIFVNASRVDNFPGALLEAAGAGLVVVSTAAGGIPIMFRNGKDALLVEPGDWEGLSAAIERILECPSLASNLAAEAGSIARRSEWNQVRAPLYRAYGFSLPEREVPPEKESREYPCIAG